MIGDIINCEHCGAEIIRTTPTKRYCAECSKIKNKIRAAQRHKEIYKKKKDKSKRKVIKSRLSLDEKIKRADELGMSYGKYVQAVERGLIKE